MHWKRKMQSKRHKNSLQSGIRVLIYTVNFAVSESKSRRLVSFVLIMFSDIIIQMHYIWSPVIQSFISFHPTKPYPYLTKRTFLRFGTSGLVLWSFHVIKGLLIELWNGTIHMSQGKLIGWKQVKAVISLSQK